MCFQNKIVLRREIAAIIGNIYFPLWNICNPPPSHALYFTFNFVTFMIFGNLFLIFLAGLIFGNYRATARVKNYFLQISLNFGENFLPWNCSQNF